MSTLLGIISHGGSGIVLAKSKSTVIKIPFHKTDKSDLLIENAIYKRLGEHPYITKFIEEINRALILERLQYPLRKRLEDLLREGTVPLTERAIT
jgi:hypothetical protein